MHHLGCDVSKQKLDFCLLIESSENQNDKKDSYARSKTKVLPNTKAGIAELAIWLRKNGVTEFSSTHIAMEGTGVYHENAAYELVQQGFIVSICNPSQTKRFGQGIGIRNKTDRVDSYVLACFCKITNPRHWRPPSPESRALKAYIARADALNRDLIREQNRGEKASSTLTPEEVTQSIKENIRDLKARLEKMYEVIEGHINHHDKLKNDMRLITSIPAIGNKVGAAMLALLHCHTFDSAEQLASYLGLAPIERQSGTSLAMKSKMSKHGPVRMRALLYMASITAIRSNGNPIARDLYERLVQKGKPKKAALGAVMRKLAHICFGVLRNQTSFDPNEIHQKKQEAKKTECRSEDGC